MGRDGEVKQRQHFYHHGDTICHPKSGYVTTKLHGTSTCGLNNNAIFSDRAIFTFPTGAVSQPRKSGRCKPLPVGSEMAALLNSLSFAFANSFLPKYRVKYYDYIVKWCSGV